MNKLYIVTATVAVVVGGAVFFGGMQYQKSQTRSLFTQRGGFMQQNGQGGIQRQGAANGLRPVNGEIISQDDSSVTVKMPDNSTKIIILSEKTTITKASSAEKADLKTGEQINVFGTQNADGSITAQNISLGGMFRAAGAPSSSATPNPAK